MNMKKPAIALICLFLCVPSQARIITVDDDGPADFNNIWAAVLDANHGDTVVVADGTYTGEGNRYIDFLDKAITVRSENGPTNCIIDCEGGWAFVVNCSSPSCAVDGFTIMGVGATEIGVKCVWYARVRNCIFRDGLGGAVYVYGKNWDTGIEAINCTFVNNVGEAVAITGGLKDKITLRNCISWGNATPDLSVHGSKSGVPWIYADFSILQSDWYSDTHIVLENCVVTDPCFADPCSGDYHLKSQAGRWDPNSESWVIDDVTSPAIDAGDPADPIGYEPFPNGGIVNMGAYGGTGEASKSYFGTTPCETIVAGDINGDCKVDFLDFAFIAFHWLEDNSP
jgi:hypothetical protein